MRTIRTFGTVSLAAALLGLSVPNMKLNLLRANSAYASGGTVYYVSPSGRDSNSGTAPTAAWQTIAKVDATTFQPGDSVLFQGGSTFSGSITFGAASRGAAASPITVGSYGTGRATISAANNSAVSVYDTSGFHITGLNIVGSGSGVVDGISFYNDLAGNVTLPYVHIDNVEVSHFGGNGITIGGWNANSGFGDIRVTDASLHDNGRSGLSTYAQNLYVNTNVYVGHVRAYNNQGIPTYSSPTGNGIVLGSVAGGTIERCVAYNNGVQGTAGAGIWTYDSTNVTIQYNESYGNHTATATDGDGFDLDQNVTNSVMQYNYSHGNDGSGYLYSESGNVNSGNTVRYNISENDGRANNYGAIYVWGGVHNADIYNNTVFVGPSAGTTPRAIQVYGWSGSGVHIRDNIVEVTGGVPLVDVNSSGGAGLLLQGNDYYAADGNARFLWSGATYIDVASWRAATGQETVGGSAVGLSSNPALRDPGNGGTIGDANKLASLAAYQLQDGSPLINAGLDLRTLAGLSPGPTDFYGNPTPYQSAFDIGAHEWTPALAAPANAPTSTAVPPTSTAVPPTSTAVPPTSTATSKPIQPSATATAVPTNTATAVPTNTAVRPTATPPVPPTSTAVPPTSTATSKPIQPSATPPLVPTNTATAVRPTATAPTLPTATATPRPKKRHR